MLLRPFSGVGLRAYGHDGVDITSRLLLPYDFMRVDADYTARPPGRWAPGDWPRTYQSPAFANIFAAWIAFAPPHAISVPRTSTTHPRTAHP